MNFSNYWKNYLKFFKFLWWQNKHLHHRSWQTETESQCFFQISWWVSVPELCFANFRNGNGQSSFRSLKLEIRNWSIFQVAIRCFHTYVAYNHVCSPSWNINWRYLHTIFTIPIIFLGLCPNQSPTAISPFCHCFFEHHR